MSTLHDRLVALAEDAPDAPPDPGLWERGTRYRRRRRAGTAVVLVAAVAAVAVLGSLSWLRSPRAVEPLPATSPAGLPDRLYDASPWLPGTDEVGELGQLAAVVPAARGSWSGIDDDLSLVGISAVTGEYRFLDLPGLIPESASLAPDGRHLAYAFTDRDRYSGLADGVAIYDPETGDTWRHPLPGELGVTVDDLLWAGDDTLLVGWATVAEATEGTTAARSERPLTWTAGEEAPTSLPTDHYLVSAGPGTVLLENGKGRYFLGDARTGEERASFVTGGAAFRVVVDATGERLATLEDNRAPGQVLVGPTSPSPVQLTRTGDGPRAYLLLGWVDADHLAVLWQRDLDAMNTDVVLLDVATGAVDVVVTRVPDDARVATDLLSEPAVRAVEPADPMDPRLVTGLGLGILLAAAAAVTTWRRRVRP